MPRFYFHVSDGEGFCQNEEGQDLSDAEAARREAVRSARLLMADDLQRGELNLGSCIQVEAEGGEHLFTVRFDEIVTIRGRQPA